MFGIFKKLKDPSYWHRLQRGQAMVEYWPTFPVGIMVMIAASALVGPVGQAFQVTSNHLNGICDYDTTPTATYTDLDGGHRIEVVASNYDEDNDRTTVTFRVSSGDSPAISHWVLGIDEDTANRIVASSEAHEDWGLDPTTGKEGIKFDIGYGDGGPPKYRAFAPASSKVFADQKFGAAKDGAFAPSHNMYKGIALAPAYDTYVEEREITLTLTGSVDFVDEVEVTTKAGASQVSTGYVSVPVSGTDSDCEMG